MNLSLNRHVEELIARRVQSGQYASPEEVVEAALGALESNEKYGDFAPGDLDRLIEEGRSSDPLDGETFLKELRELRESLLLRTKR
jgi:putative addiction module CopG family antidote